MSKALMLVVVLMLVLAWPVGAHEHQIYTAQPVGDTYLLWALTDIPGMVVEFEVEVPSVVVVSGHVGLQTLRYDVTVGFAVDVTMDGERIQGSVAGEGVQIDRHYYDAQVHGVVDVGPGEHLITARGRSYSGWLPGQGKLGFVKPPDYGLLIVKVYSLPAPEPEGEVDQ